MKSTGVVRKLDQLGRIVIPKEIRNSYDINEKDPLEIFVDGEHIILKKYSPNQACMVTGEVSPHNVVLANGKLVLSPTAIELLKSELGKQTTAIR